MELSLLRFGHRFTYSIVTLSLVFTASIAAAASYTNEVEFEIDDSEKLPLSVGYTLTDSMDDHTHRERVCNTTYRIRNGDLHSKLVANVLSSVFEEAKEVNLEESSSLDGIDLVVVISPGDTPYGWWQISLPCRTRLDVFENWFKYKVTLEDQEGVQIAQWEQYGFGRISEEEVDKRRSLGIEGASSRAFIEMRAKLIYDFRNNEEILNLINDNPEEPEVDLINREPEQEATQQRPEDINIQPDPSGANLVEDLNRLQELYEQGVLNEEEFNAAKRRLLGL